MNRPLKRLPVVQNGRFANYIGERPESVFWRSMIMFAQSFLKRRSQKIDKNQWLDIPSHNQFTGLDSIEWIGHASFLITINGLRIITDPVFGDLFLFPRILPASYTIANPPQVDVILISHNHRDHMDEATLKALFKRNPQATCYVPQGDKTWFAKRGYSNVHEAMWWDIFNVNSDITLTFLPTKHWSQRGLFDRNKSLWGSWMISTQNGQNIYFGGDTAYSSHFKEIAAHFGPIQHALLPIAPCEPHEWMKETHINAHQAVQAYQDLNALNFIPMHWGAFWFGTDEFNLPIEQLHAAWKQAALEEQNLLIAKIAQKLPIFIDVPAATREITSILPGQL